MDIKDIIEHLKKICVDELGGETLIKEGIKKLEKTGIEISENSKNVLTCVIKRPAPHKYGKIVQEWMRFEIEEDGTLVVSHIVEPTYGAFYLLEKMEFTKHSLEKDKEKIKDILKRIVIYKR